MINIKELAQAEAEKRNPIPTDQTSLNCEDDVNVRNWQKGFIEGAEFGYNQRWIPVTPETMPAIDEDKFSDEVLVCGYDKTIYLTESENVDIAYHTHWQPITPPNTEG